MSLAFLAKKSWHTTNLKNVERVWMAEQKGEEEKKKVIELQKQIAEERQIQELRQLQVASGHVVKIVDNTLDWMYEGPAAEKIQEQSTEEYLLGKTYKPKEEKSSDLQKVGNSAGATWLNKTSSKNDMFTRLHEDPMLLIKQNEKRNLESVLRNPLKMERIRNSVAAQLDDVERKKKEKKAAKQLKKSMKKEKERKRARSSSSSRSASPDRSNQHGSRAPETAMRPQPHSNKFDSRGRDADLSSNRQRSRSRDRKGNSDRGSGRNEDHHSSRRRSSSRDRGGNSERGAGKHEDHHSSRRRSSSRDRGGNSDRGAGKNEDHHSSRRRSSSRDRGGNSERGSGRNEDHHSSRQRSSSRDRGGRNEDAKSTAVGLKQGDVREKPPDAVQNKKYGLLVKGNGSTGNSHKDGVGPSLVLLAKKADEEKREKESRNRPRENVKKLTAEEREERIRQMESDASESNANRLERVQRSQTAVVDKDEKPLNEEATFINSMRTEVYVTDGTTMTERLQQNRHYIQKGSDLDSTGFIKK